MNKGFHKKAHINPEPGFQSGPGGSIDADKMAPCLLVTKPSPSLGRSSEKKKKAYRGYVQLANVHSIGVHCRQVLALALDTINQRRETYTAVLNGFTHSRVKFWGISIVTVSK